jgi:hypothetical protein
MFDFPTVCIGRVGAYCGVVHLTDPYSWITDNALYVSELLVDLDIRYLTQALTAARLNRYASQGGQPLISAGRIYPVKIPVLPIGEQHRFSAQIVEIEGLRQSESDLKSSGLLLERSLSAHAFSGQLTADWREAHQDKLANEARARDTALKEAGAIFSRRTMIEEVEGLLEDRTDGIYSDLSREQRDLLREIKRMVGRVRYARYFSAALLSDYLTEGPLRRNPQAVEGHLAVLAALGLIIPVSREEQTEDTGEFVFGNAYRLPLEDYEPSEGEGGEPRVGDHSRLRELERLAAQLEKERSLK